MPRVGAAEFVHEAAFGGYTALAGRQFETNLPPHVHASYVLGVVEQGTVQVTTAHVSMVAQPGTVVLLEPFTVHTELPTEGGWSFRYLYPSESVIREVLGTPDDGGRALQFPRPVLHDPALASAIRRVHDTLRYGDGASRDAFVTLVRQLRNEACGSPESRPPVARRNIRAVRDMLTARPLRNVRSADLARAAGLSQYHFTRLFKSEIGLPPYAFFEQVRIAHAHDLIYRGEDLTAVAYRLGFADQSHLTRHFHRGSFTTPGQLAHLVRRAPLTNGARSGARTRE